MWDGVSIPGVSSGRVGGCKEGGREGGRGGGVCGVWGVCGGGGWRCSPSPLSLTALTLAPKPLKNSL